MEETAKNTNLANFYLALTDLQEQLAFHQWSVETNEQISNKMLQGESFLSSQLPKITAGLARQVVEAVATATVEWQPGPEKLSQSKASQLTSLGDEGVIQLIQTAVTNAPQMKKQWAEQLNISQEMMDFLATNMAKPILTTYGAASLKLLDLDQWKNGHCPICGESPVMAKLTGKYGNRVLYCGQCETEWAYDRLGCPYCGNKDTNKLSFITPETMKQYRLYLCEECKSYLKTVDERQCGKVDLFCEDLATADFDTLAVAEGYRRGNKRDRA